MRSSEKAVRSAPRAGVVLALVAGLVAAGCGADEKASSPKAKPSPQQSSAATDGAAYGRKVFQRNCSLCHTLADAGAKGDIGPNLDEMKPDKQTVVLQVERTLDMPREQIEAVADYVVTHAGE